ncbi:hypothetical protein Tco_0732094 [Tanacetum coccineum]
MWYSLQFVVIFGGVFTHCPLGGPPGHVTIQTEFFFNKDLEYLRFGNKGSMHVLSISKMKAARYPDLSVLNLLSAGKQMWIKKMCCTYDISAKYGIGQLCQGIQIRAHLGMNTRFGTERDMTMEQRFITAFERRTEDKEDYRNLGNLLWTDVLWLKRVRGNEVGYDIVITGGMRVPLNRCQYGHESLIRTTSSVKVRERYKACDHSMQNIYFKVYKGDYLLRLYSQSQSHILTQKTFGKNADDFLVEPYPADNFQNGSGCSSENLIESLSNSLALLTQSYKSHLPQTNNQLRTSSNARNKATVQDGRVVVQDVRGRYNANNQGKPFQRNNARGNVVAGNVGVLDEEQSLFLAGEQVTNFDEDVDNSPENDLALNVDHVFEADECDAFDSDVDEGPTTQTMFMTNLTSEDRIYDETGPSYDSNTPFEVQDHDTFVNHLDEYHEVHEMQTDEQHNYVVDSDADYTSDSNIIPYDQYVEDNEDHVVQSNVSSVRNDALMSILDEMHEQGVQSRLANKPNMIVNDLVTSELARYKELVREYEKQAKFKLTDRERKIDEQMRIIILDRNRKETSLKSELHSAQILLSSIVGHYKSKTEEDQSVQTVHMLCKPKSFYDEKNKVAIGYKNPLCLTRAKQAQSALYNGHVLVTTNHTPTVIHDSEDTREIAEITRKRMLPPLLPIPLPAPSTSRKADIPEADTPPRKRLLLTTPRRSYEVGESSAAPAARQPGPTMTHIVYYSLMFAVESSEFYSRHHDAQKDCAAVRAQIEALARFEAYCRALEARVTVLETEVHRHEWQRQAADDFAVRHIMRTQALEAGARVDTLEDTGSSS